LIRQTGEEKITEKTVYVGGIGCYCNQPGACFDVAVAAAWRPMSTGGQLYAYEF